MQKFSPKRAGGPGHVTPKIFGIQSNLSSELLTWARDFKFGKQLPLGKAERTLK